MRVRVSLCLTVLHAIKQAVRWLRHDTPVSPATMCSFQVGVKFGAEVGKEGRDGQSVDALVIMVVVTRGSYWCLKKDKGGNRPISCV